MSTPSLKRRRSPRPSAPTRRRLVTRRQAAAIDYRDPATLRPFLSARGRIRPAAQTGLSRRDQRRLAREVKRARELALLPYVAADPGDQRRRPSSAD